MKQYSEERKQAVLKRVMPPENPPVSVLVEETGISDVTLYHWRKQARSRGLVVPKDGRYPENWSPEDKFAVVLETATINEAELADYCRKKGLFAGQIAQWKESCIQGNLSAARQAKAARDQARSGRKEIKDPGYFLQMLEDLGRRAQIAEGALANLQAAVDAGMGSGNVPEIFDYFLKASKVAPG